MSEIWKPQPNEVYMSWVDTILNEASDKLNDWETHFMSNMLDKVSHRWPLTEGQAKSLEKIYAEKTK